MQLHQPRHATASRRSDALRTVRRLGMALIVIVGVVSCGNRTVVVYQQSPPPPQPNTVYVEPAPTVTYVQQPPPPPPPQQQVVYYADDPQQSVEVTTVIYREYYGFSDDEVVMMPHYRRYYHVDDDDLFFVGFVARQSHVSFDVAFNQFYFGCGGDYNRMIVVYNVDPVVFFVPVPPGAVYPTIYYRPYNCYHNGTLAGAQFSNNEFHAMISLKIGVEYQGTTSEVFFRNTQTYGSPNRALYQNRDRCGMGGHACAGMAYHPCPHPWTMSVSARASWHSDYSARQSSHESAFREQHRDQIERVNRGEGYAAHRPAGGPDHPGAPGPRLNDHPGDRPGDHPGDRLDDHRSANDPNRPLGQDHHDSPPGQPRPDDQTGDHPGDHPTDHAQNHPNAGPNDQHGSQTHNQPADKSGNQPHSDSSHKQDKEKDDKGSGH